MQWIYIKAKEEAIRFFKEVFDFWFQEDDPILVVCG
jgi:hypothetical protein